MTELSPVAQAVLDTVANLYWDRIDPSDVSSSAVAAAALRTAADQLINVKWSVEMWELHQEFHAIADELESSQEVE